MWKSAAGLTHCCIVMTTSFAHWFYHMDETNPRADYVTRHRSVGPLSQNGTPTLFIVTLLSRHSDGSDFPLDLKRKVNPTDQLCNSSKSETSFQVTVVLWRRHPSIQFMTLNLDGFVTRGWTWTECIFASHINLPYMNTRNSKLVERNEYLKTNWYSLWK